jgi:hypothetical protein
MASEAPAAEDPARGPRRMGGEVIDSVDARAAGSAGRGFASFACPPLALPLSPAISALCRLGRALSKRWPSVTSGANRDTKDLSCASQRRTAGGITVIDSDEQK